MSRASLRPRGRLIHQAIAGEANQRASTGPATVKAADKDGKPLAGVEVSATDASGAAAARQKTDDHGVAKLRLSQYKYANGKKAEAGEYTIICGEAKAKARMNQDSEVTLTVP